MSISCSVLQIISAKCQQIWSIGVGLLYNFFQKNRISQVDTFFQFENKILKMAENGPN